MNTHHLRQFLVYCGKEGYATLNDSDLKVEADQSTSIYLDQGEWKFHDNYFGGEPYGGREAVFFQDKPVWIMTYYGKVSMGVDEIKPLYAFLRSALSHIPDQAPFRGPKEYVENEWKYENIWDGNVEDFSGEETISRNGRKVYSAKYLGGLINLT